MVNGIEAIVVAGTSGENSTLEIHEHAQLVDFSIRKCAGKAKVLVGVGGNNTSACLKKAKNAAEAGADAVMMTAPYYNKCSKDGMIKHFKTIADEVDVPLILYNVPSRTSIGISFEVYRALHRHPNINGTKEASGDISLIGKIITELGDNFNLWSGNDDNTIALMSMGAKGVISVASNIIPAEIAQLCSLCGGGNYKAAWEIFRKYRRLMELMFIDVNPIPVKTAMKLMDMDKGHLRLPLTDIEASKENLIKAELEKLGLI